MEFQVHQQLKGMTCSILHIFFLILFIYSGMVILYLFVLSIGGHFRKKRTQRIYSNKKRIAVLITAYKEDNIILHTVRQALGHNYPGSAFRVFVAADHLQEHTVQALKKTDAEIISLNSTSSSKARSLNALLNHIEEEAFEVALILDSDNIMLPGFMEQVNIAFQEGFCAVQGHRMAKNKDTAVAVLDALSEEINNHLFRQSQRAAGFSSSLIGSGMAFSFSKLKTIYNKPGILDNPACDREVDFEMMKEGMVVEYLPDARLLDEKVAGRKVYENQRRRWLESQAIHLRLFFSEKVPEKTKDYWNKLFINLLLPRLMFLIVLLCMTVISVSEYFFHTQYTGILFVYWLGLLAAYFVTLLLSIPRHCYNLKTLRALLSLPLLMFTFLKSATGLHVNRKEFVHTPKSFTDDNV